MQLIQQSLRIYLRSYLHPYEQLKTCEQDILDMIEKEFSGQLGMIDDQQPFVNTLWLSNCTKIYSSWIHRADKFLKDLMDLHESFRKVSFLRIDKYFGHGNSPVTFLSEKFDENNACRINTDWSYVVLV
jgi:hypothetical protein